MKLPVKLKKILSSKLNVGLIVGLLVLVIASVVLVPKIFNKGEVLLPLEEIDLAFDAEGPYAIVEPRRDGNAINLYIKRVAGYGKINYELAYQSRIDVEPSTTKTAKKPVINEGEEGEGIDRGVTGEIKETEDEKNRKSEYFQEILFGTCSRSNTWDTLHCVFDKNVENGTLTLRIYKKPVKGETTQKVFKMITTWHMQKPDVALGKITSGDNHFLYTTTASRQDLANIAYTVVNDLSGAPKLPEGKKFLGKVYAFNIPTAKQFPSGEVTIELAEDPAEGAKVAVFDEKNNNWRELETTVGKGVLKAKADGAGIFAVLAGQ